jgi:hypothetical protein
VSQLVASGLPLPVSGEREASTLALVAAAPRVANTLPIGAIWGWPGRLRWMMSGSIRKCCASRSRMPTARTQ